MANDSDSSFTDDDLRSLGEKLASLELTAPEQAALAAVLEGEGEVAGFGRFDILPTIKVGFRGVRNIRADEPWGVRKSPAGLRSATGDIGDAGKRTPGRF